MVVETETGIFLLAKLKRRSHRISSQDRMGPRHLVNSVALNNHGAFLSPVFSFNWGIIILVGLQRLMERMAVTVLEKLVKQHCHLAIASERGSVLILSAEERCAMGDSL